MRTLINIIKREIKQRETRQRERERERERKRERWHACNDYFPPLIRSAAFSPIIIEPALVLHPGTVGITDASTTRKLLTPRTCNVGDTTADLSSVFMRTHTHTYAHTYARTHTHILAPSEWFSFS